MKASANAGDDQSGGGEGGMNSSMSVSSFNPTSKLSIDSSAMDLSTASTSAGSTTSGTHGGTLSSTMGLKTLVIASSSLALGCKVTELFVLLNYYDEAGQQGENVSSPCLTTCFPVLTRPTAHWMHRRHFHHIDRPRPVFHQSLATDAGGLERHRKRRLLRQWVSGTRENFSTDRHDDWIGLRGVGQRPVPHPLSTNPGRCLGELRY